MKQIKKYIWLVFICLGALGACDFAGNKKDEGNVVQMVYTDWSESVAITHLAKVLLEEKLEYDVVIKLANVEEVYESLANGKAHVFADGWLPVTHRSHIEKYPSGAIDQIGIIYPGARTGLIVPAYSLHQSIDDLSTGSTPEIIGIEAEAGVMMQTEIAAKKYGLTDTKLLATTEDDMIEKFVDAYNRRKEIVITGWEPHWLFERFDIRFLDDPKSVFGEKENIVAMGTENLAELRPRAYRFFERMQLSEKQFNRLIYFVEQHKDPEIGIREWIQKNEYVVNQWIKGLKPERIKIM